MVKLVFLLRRLPHLSRAEFQRYWRETHGPLVARHADVLRIQRYVQTHAIETPYAEAIRVPRGTGEPYDGAAELWWESLDDLAAAAATPAGQAAGAALLEDERRFIDLPRSSLFFCEEHTLVERGREADAGPRGVSGTLSEVIDGSEATEAGSDGGRRSADRRR
jgi:uncharacterized protein (TIGR02118 family)